MLQVHYLHKLFTSLKAHKESVVRHLNSCRQNLAFTLLSCTDFFVELYNAGILAEIFTSAGEHHVPLSNTQEVCELSDE